MGLDVHVIHSDERHFGSFVCVICQNLVGLDALATKCSHVYCSTCLPSWLEKSSTCPTCNQNLLYSNDADHSSSMQINKLQVLVQPLEKAQPLAHRLLKTILVECPLRKQGVSCDWKGDYSDLQAHLLSSTAHAPVSEVNDATKAITNQQDSSPSRPQHYALTLAHSLKEQANGHFECKQYKDALSIYTKAITVLREAAMNPENNDYSSEVNGLLATLYSNRAAANLQLGEYQPCIDDCEIVIHNLDSSNEKVYVRASRAAIQLGSLHQAQAIILAGLQASPSQTTLKKEQHKINQLLLYQKTGTEQLNSHQYAAAKGTFGSLLKTAPSAKSYLLGAARADLGLGLTDSALRLTKRVLMQHPRSPMGYWIRGQTLFLMEETEMGIKLLQEALRLDPDSDEIKVSLKSCKKVKECMDVARQKMFNRSFIETVDLLTQCIEQCVLLPPKAPLFASLHTQRAEAYLRLKDYSKTLKDCAVVLYVQEDNIPTWLTKFQAYHGLEDHEGAMEEIRHLLKRFEQDDRLRKAYEKADFLLRKKRRVDYYQLLGVSAIASAMEIKKAYKAKSLQYHPDRLPPGSTPEQQKEASGNFQLLGEALEILCDDFQRKLYDEGYDAAAIRDRVQAANQAAHHHKTSGYQHYH